MSYKTALISLGCAKNLVDSEMMLGILKENNFDIIEDPRNAEIIIINTCAFIEDAKQESIDTIIEAGRYKKEGKCKLLVVTGCLSQRYGKKLQRGMPEIDAILGTSSYPEIVDTISLVLKGSQQFKLKRADHGIFEGLPRLQTTPEYTAYLKIADGCDNLCSYCIIPMLRGRYRSRKEENIIDETRQLALQGVKEVILVAQDITKYGIDLYGEYRLARLLDGLCQIEGIKWIRLQYCYPDGINDELINIIKNRKKICKYLDIPIQHISERILKKMNRKSTSKEIESLVTRLKKEIPEIILRTTLIVGFPGESGQDFKELLKFVKKGYFDRLGVFIYSREEGTPAYHMKDQVDEKTAQERQKIIMEAQQSISLNKNRKKIGKIIKVLIEGNEGSAYFGRTYGDSPEIDNLVYFSSDLSLQPGKFVKVKISQAFEYDLIGECVNESS